MTAQHQRSQQEFNMIRDGITTFDKHIYDLIEEEAKRWPADLIVIGTHGRRGLSRLFLGSVAEALARISSKPLLLIRGG